MTSSTGDLFRLLNNRLGLRSEKITMKHGKESENGSQYSYDNIVKLLNLETDEQRQAEGNILISIFGNKRFFTFDNHTIERGQQRK